MTTSSFFCFWLLYKGQDTNPARNELDARGQASFVSDEFYTPHSNRTRTMHSFTTHVSKYSGFLVSVQQSDTLSLPPVYLTKKNLVYSYFNINFSYKQQKRVPKRVANNKLHAVG
jgi:hypothetical protein